MADQEEATQVSMHNTKKEILDAYYEILEKYKERTDRSLDVGARKLEHESEQAVRTAEGLSAESVELQIGELKGEIGALLGKVANRLESEVGKFQSLQKAIQIKDEELRQIYEIERAAESLVVLIEAERQKRDALEAELADRRKKLEQEIKGTRIEWEKEAEHHADQVAERNVEESKKRQREQEEFRYEFEKEKRRTRDQFEEEKTKLERELKLKAEELDRRQESIAGNEQELNALRQRVEGFQQELDAAVATAVQGATERLKAEAAARAELLQKEFEGERNVLKTRIEALEVTIQEQVELIARLSQGQDKAYQQVQDIAVKAIEGASNLKSALHLQRTNVESAKKGTQED